MIFIMWNVVKKSIKYELSKIPYYTRVLTSLFPLYDQYYLDCIQNVDYGEEYDFEGIQNLYEHIYELTIKKDMISHVPSFFCKRETKNYSIADVFLDYINVMPITTLEYDELYGIIVIGMMAWNENHEYDLSSLNDEQILLLEFFGNRKKRYFSNYKEYIVDFDLNMDYGIDLRLDIAKKEE